MQVSVADNDLENVFVEIYIARLSINAKSSYPNIENSLSSKLESSQSSELKNDEKNKTYFGVEATILPLDRTRKTESNTLGFQASLLNRAAAGESFAATAGILNILDL